MMTGFRGRRKRIGKKEWVQIDGWKHEFRLRLPISGGARVVRLTFNGLISCSSAFKRSFAHYFKECAASLCGNPRNLRIQKREVAEIAVSGGFSFHPHKTQGKPECNPQSVKDMKLTFTTFLLICFAWIAPLSIARAQGTAFTYQGRLNNGGSGANGTYDFRFRLAADPVGPTYIGSPYLTNGIFVTNGLFTATPDFGAGILNGSNYWLEVSVRTNGAIPYTALAPLQKLTPTPYAVFAASSSNLLGTLPASQLSGSIANGNFPVSPSFSGVNVSNVNALSLNGISSAGFWQLGGNNVSPGQFLGSTNNQPVEIWAGGQRGIRFEPSAGGSPNIIIGSPNNSISGGVNSSVISGGYQNSSQGSATLIGGGGYNAIQSNSAFAAIVAGSFNYIQTNTYNSFIGGGLQNMIGGNAYGSIVGGYLNNLKNSSSAFIGGGAQNDIETANYSVIAGGVFNTNFYGNVSAIGGGWHNIINYLSDFSVIAGGVDNQISFYTVGGTIGGGSNNLVAGVSSTVSGGEYNRATAFRDTVGGGVQNTASGGISTVGGGWTNTASGNSSTIGGGDHNLASGVAASIGGGNQNYASGQAATVPGGQNNSALGFASFAAGQNARAWYQGSFVWADSQNVPFISYSPDEFAVRANSGMRIQSNVGIHLDAADRPIITRDWDPFASNAPNGKSGIGRWGMFMEPAYLTIGIPDLANRYFQIAKYNTNGTPSTLAVVDQAGNLTVTGSLVANLNVICNGNVVAHGVVLTSDRDAKEHFKPLDAKSVLAKVAALPITEWNYKDEGIDARHLGPMAQDFHAAFSLNGTDDKHISVVDEGGVALAAIQGLHQELTELKSENAELKQRLAALEKLLQSR